MWTRISELRGDAYTEGLLAYRAEKARVKQLYRDTHALGRAAGASPTVSALAPRGQARTRIPGLAHELTEAFVAGELDLSQRIGAPARPGWAGMPECIVADRMRADGSSDSAVRLLLTFTATMDRARDADKLWFAAEALWHGAPWAFDPSEIVRRGLTELADMLRKHGVSQRHTPDAAAWRVLAESLSSDAIAPAVHRAVLHGEGDAAGLVRELQSTSTGGTARFPFLRGPKVGPMWVRMLAYPGAAAISSLEALPVAVDVQVRKVSEYLGAVDTGGLDLEAARPIIQAAWAEDVRAHGATGPGALTGTAAAVDPALWFWGKWGCTRCEREGKTLPDRLSLSPLPIPQSNIH